MPSGGAIKGWDKKQERDTSVNGKDVPAIWENASKNPKKIVRVLLGTKRVKISKTTSKGTETVDKGSYDKQETAHDKAMKFMRNNPKP